MIILCLYIWCIHINTSHRIQLVFTTRGESKLHMRFYQVYVFLLTTPVVV